MNCLYLTHGDQNCSKLKEVVRVITGSTQSVLCNFRDCIIKNIKPNCGIFEEALK